MFFDPLSNCYQPIGKFLLRCVLHHKATKSRGRPQMSTTFATRVLQHDSSKWRNRGCVQNCLGERSRTNLLPFTCVVLPEEMILSIATIFVFVPIFKTNGYHTSKKSSDCSEFMISFQTGRFNFWCQETNTDRRANPYMNVKPRTTHQFQLEAQDVSVDPKRFNPQALV